MGDVNYYDDFVDGILFLKKCRNYAVVLGFLGGFLELLERG